MAASYRTSSAFGNNTGAALVGAFSASSGDYLVAFVSQKGNTSGAASVTDDAGGTWWNPNNNGAGSGAGAISGGWWIRNKLVATTATINITATPSTAGGALSSVTMVVVAVSGMRSINSAGFGNGYPVRAWNSVGSVGLPSTPSASWSLTTKTTSMLLEGVSNLANPPGLTVPTGFTSRQNTGQTAPLGIEVATVDSGRADTSEAWSSSATTWFTSGIELDPLVSDGNAMGETIGTGGLGYNALTFNTMARSRNGVYPNGPGYTDGLIAGVAQVQNTSFVSGLQYGRNFGYDEGHDAGVLDTIARSIAIGVSIVPPGSDTPPVITTVSAPVSPSDPLVLSIYDNKGISFYHVTCQDGSTGPRYTVWDPHDNLFSFPFDPTRSTVTGTGKVSDPYIFTIYRLGGWPRGLSMDVRARAVGNYGNEADS